VAELRDLLASLRRGERPALLLDDVELLLGWLTGSAARGRGRGSDLPRPGHDPVLLQMVLYRLDDEVFEAGELKLAAAGLDSGVPASRRRTRFRRLASAFHPDRFPDLSDWLTQRSQAVHRAYARFKREPAAPKSLKPKSSKPKPGPAKPASQNVQRSPAGVRKHWNLAFANRLRARFGSDRYLTHKLIGGLAVLALLPVLNMALVPSAILEKRSGAAISSGDAVTGFRFPVSGKSVNGGSQGTGRDGIPDGGGTDRGNALAGGQEPPFRKPETRSSTLGSPGNHSGNAGGELALGPFGSHPVGEVLKRFHSALQAGNIPGIAEAFTRNAQFKEIQGRSSIADHFREMLAGAESRQVDLKVFRLTRDDDRWKVGTELEIRLQRGGPQQNALKGRAELWLVERGKRLAISRLEIE